MAKVSPSNKSKTTKVTLLSKSELKRIKALGPNWQIDDKNKKLSATFTFNTFLDSFMFATRVVVHAEVLNHHPELCIVENVVKVTLTTPSEKHVTAIDIELAERVNQISTRLRVTS